LSAAMLAACGAPDTPAAAAEADTAPAEQAATEAAPESTETAEVAETPAAAPADPEVVPASAGEEDADHAHDEHVDEAKDESEDHDHDHDEHAEDGDHDEHDHAAHAHDDHDHAGGDAHVHGEAEIAIALDGNTLTVSLNGALASFGLTEAEPETDEARAVIAEGLAPFNKSTTLVALPDAAGCTETEADAGTDYSRGPGNLVADYTFTCTNPDALSEADFPIFADYSTLEKIDAVWLVGSDQAAKTLTLSDSSIAP
ncbi:MAG: DUF2796 domain-containing protein, partial [Pseudomonadota bacterium]